MNEKFQEAKNRYQSVEIPPELDFVVASALREGDRRRRRLRWQGRTLASLTLGITGLSLPRVHIDGVVWHLDVGSSHPGAVVGPKGWAVRPLKRYASWVQNVVRQFGPYPAWA